MNSLAEETSRAQYSVKLEKKLANELKKIKKYIFLTNEKLRKWVEKYYFDEFFVCDCECAVPLE